jgi:hypothetical protein
MKERIKKRLAITLGVLLVATLTTSIVTAGGHGSAYLKQKYSTQGFNDGFNAAKNGQRDTPPSYINAAGQIMTYRMWYDEGFHDGWEWYFATINK